MRDFHLPGRSRVLAANGICAASHPLAAKVAVQILEAGGNAVDAAIAAATLLGICEPMMTGLGGDCFVLLKPPGEERVLALNGSGRAPVRADAAQLRARGWQRMPEQGVDTVTVPGAVDALCRLSADWGRLGLAASLAPAIRYAEEGVPVAPRTAHDWAENAGWLQGDARRHFLFQDRPLTIGQMFRAPGQAKVLRRIAREGRDGFYQGEVAEDMVATLNMLGGVHSLDDFAATACQWGDPVAGTYKDIELLEHPPNGQGATAILMLNILSHFDLATLDPFGPVRAHIEAEAAKLAYDARNRFIADPAHTTRLDHMLNPATATALAALIDRKRALPDPARATQHLHRDTVYLTVVDRDRMAVSLIYSIYFAFGSGIASSRYGILMQNRGAGFSLQPGHPNELGGGKRPMHTIIPGMVRTAGKVLMPFGVMGGAYQPCGHARLVTNLVDFGMDIQSAIDAPRCFAGADGLSVERGYGDRFRADMATLGHRITTPDEPIGGAQAILIRPDGVLEAGSDPRKDGCALGY